MSIYVNIIHSKVACNTHATQIKITEMKAESETIGLLGNNLHVKIGKIFCFCECILTSSNFESKCGTSVLVD